jgi:hypothetical protein
LIGTETYGRTKTVGMTPIVTTFFLMFGFPVSPLRSYCFARKERRIENAVPFFGHDETLIVHGYPLAQLDRHSVVMAYVRAALAVTGLIGFLGMVPLASMLLCGIPLIPVAMRLATIFFVLLVASVIGAATTYLVPTVGPRERTIRLHCGELLSCCADPARLAPEAARRIRKQLVRSAPPIPFIDPPQAEAIRVPNADANVRSRSELIRELILARCRIVEETDERGNEAVTDELLARLA